MPKIIFIKDHKNEENYFKKGHTMDVNEASANHFIRRGAAEIYDPNNQDHNPKKPSIKDDK